MIPAEKGNSTNVAQCIWIFSKWKQSLEKSRCLKRTIKEQGRCQKRAKYKEIKAVSEKTAKAKCGCHLCEHHIKPDPVAKVPAHVHPVDKADARL